MSETPSFSGFVPGFDFLQDLVKNAGAALPRIGQWVAPTIDPDELEKRIGELRTVQFWLEQNARMLDTTIQALEVQRMTLSTLKTMNVQMDDLRDSMKIRMPAQAPASAAAGKASVAPDARAEDAAEQTAADAGPAAAAPGTPGAVDPLQWWGALTKQFTELATQALKDTGSDAGRKLAGAQMMAAFEPRKATAAATPAAGAAKKKTAARRPAAGKPAPQR